MITYAYRQYNAFLLKYGHTDKKVHHIQNLSSFKWDKMQFQNSFMSHVHVHVKIIIATEGVEILSCRSVADFHLLGFTVGHQHFVMKEIVCNVIWFYCLFEINYTTTSRYLTQ